MHPAVDTPELRAIADTWAERVDDLDLVAAGGPLAATLAEQGVALIGWREIRDLMRSGPVGRTA